jgi:hypothetical protein
MTKPADAAPTANVSRVAMWLLLSLLILSSQFWFCDGVLSNWDAVSDAVVAIVAGSGSKHDFGVSHGDNSDDTVDDNFVLFLVSTSELGFKAAERDMAICLLVNVDNGFVAVFDVVVRDSLRKEHVDCEGQQLKENPFVVSAIVTTTSKIEVFDSVNRIPLICDLRSKGCGLSGPTVGLGVRVFCCVQLGLFGSGVYCPFKMHSWCI